MNILLFAQTTATSGSQPAIEVRLSPERPAVQALLAVDGVFNGATVGLEMRPPIAPFLWIAADDVIFTSAGIKAIWVKAGWSLRATVTSPGATTSINAGIDY